MKRRDRHNLDHAAAGHDPSADPAAAPHDAERPSKSQLKRDMLELQDLGERLLALPPAKLRALSLPETLADAIELAGRITSREGLRRQRQYIGRLMRDIDPAPLRAALDLDGATQRAEVALMHAAERWRERLLSEPAALMSLLEKRAGEDANDWARLVDEARAEQSRGTPGRRYRELYRRLRTTLAD